MVVDINLMPTSETAFLSQLFSYCWRIERSEGSLSQNIYIYFFSWNNFHSAQERVGIYVRPTKWVLILSTLFSRIERPQPTAFVVFFTGTLLHGRSTLLWCTLKYRMPLLLERNKEQVQLSLKSKSKRQSYIHAQQISGFLDFSCTFLSEKAKRFLSCRIITEIVDVGPPADWVKINVREAVCFSRLIFS